MVLCADQPPELMEDDISDLELKALLQEVNAAMQGMPGTDSRAKQTALCADHPPELINDEINALVEALLERVDAMPGKVDRSTQTDVPSEERSAQALQIEVAIQQVMIRDLQSKNSAFLQEKHDKQETDLENEQIREFDASVIQAQKEKIDEMQQDLVRENQVRQSQNEAVQAVQRNNEDLLSENQDLLQELRRKQESDLSYQHALQLQSAQIDQLQRALQSEKERKSHEERQWNMVQEAFQVQDAQELRQKIDEMAQAFLMDMRPWDGRSRSQSRMPNDRRTNSAHSHYRHNLRRESNERIRTNQGDAKRGKGMKGKGGGKGKGKGKGAKRGIFEVDRSEIPTASIAVPGFPVRVQKQDLEEQIKKSDAVHEPKATHLSVGQESQEPIQKEAPATTKADGCGCRSAPHLCLALCAFQGCDASCGRSVGPRAHLSAGKEARKPSQEETRATAKVDGCGCRRAPNLGHSCSEFCEREGCDASCGRSQFAWGITKKGSFRELSKGDKVKKEVQKEVQTAVQTAPSTGCGCTRTLASADPKISSRHVCNEGCALFTGCKGTCGSGGKRSERLRCSRYIHPPSNNPFNPRCIAK